MLYTVLQGLNTYHAIFFSLHSDKEGYIETKFFEKISKIVWSFRKKALI